MKHHRLVTFIYAAIRKLPLETVENLVKEAELVDVKEFTKADFSDARQALIARKLAERLIKRKASAKQRKHLEVNRPQ